MLRATKAEEFPLTFRSRFGDKGEIFMALLALYFDFIKILINRTVLDSKSLIFFDLFRTLSVPIVLVLVLESGLYL